MSDYKQSTLADIIDSEGRMAFEAHERYGRYFQNALSLNNLLQQGIVNVDKNHFVFACFFSSVKKHTTLALLSTVRLHHTQASMDLRQAIERQELTLHYQPQVSLKTGQITGVEALLRWQHPQMGLLQPQHFIDLAQDAGLMVPIGEWILRSACRQVNAWRQAGLTSVQLNVNIGESQLTPELPLTIQAILRETGLPPNRLELEISEDIVYGAFQEKLSIFHDLKALGVRLALDDFGNGYTSLGQLSHFDFDTLKIDRSLVSDLMSNPKAGAIIQGVMKLAQELDMMVVVEGVENIGQLVFLKRQCCSWIQGWYFAKACPADECEQVIHQGYPVIQDRPALA